MGTGQKFGAVSLLNLVIWAFLLNRFCVKGDILLPPAKEGRDVGVGIIAGAYLLPEQYVAIGEEMQDVSELRLWVYIVAGPLKFTDPEVKQPNETYTGRARAALVEAGLPHDAPYAGIGHSLGGVQVAADLTRYPEIADVCLMWASYVTTPLQDFEVPCLTMSGDLDAQTRITKMALEFQNLQEFVDGPEPGFKYKFPVAIIGGINHAQYATGEMPPLVVEYNIVPELSDQDARAQIIYFTDTFVKYWVQEGAESELEQWYEDTELITRPYLEVLDWEEDSTGSSYWVLEAQRHMASVPEEDEAKLIISNYVVSQDELPGTRSSLYVDEDNNININTTTSVVLDPPIGDYNSAFMMETKMKSHESVMEALGAIDDVIDPPPITCRHVHELAFERVWELMPELPQSRFLASGVEVIFEDDDEQFWGPGWVAAELVYEHCNGTLTIQGTSLWTSVDVGGYTGGVHYCKMMSPARAMEFMYVDSLREFPPTCI